MRANQIRGFRAAHRKRSNLVRPACRRPECAPGTAESGSVQRHGVARSRDERLLDIARGLRVPFAAAELEVTPAALPGSVSPLHVRAASPAALDLGHGQRVRGAQDVRRVRYAVVRIGDRPSLNTCLTNKTKMDSGGTWRAITGHAPSNDVVSRAKPRFMRSPRAVLGIARSAATFGAAAIRTGGVGARRRRDTSWSSSMRTMKSAVQWHRARDTCPSTGSLCACSRALAPAGRAGSSHQRAEDRQSAGQP
jgi:hypothetical protein